MRQNGSLTGQLLSDFLVFIYSVTALTCIRAVHDHVILCGNLLFLSKVHLLFFNLLLDNMFYLMVCLMNKLSSNQILFKSIFGFFLDRAGRTEQK